MVYTKVFKSGNSQAVRIPKKYHINSDRVEIIKRDNELILREKPQNLKMAFKLMTQMPEDFFAEGRVDDKPQEREF
ncbi:antitoxin [Legionella sp. W05-934-2]|jgi:antitoxin VapB|uniref:antitoxin n=1 Tax=Legionella sp. W05-934-2 TaxID=1198649 RepID=UPI00346314D1